MNYFPEYLRYIQFTDREHGWMSAKDEGAFYRTIDGGKLWVDIPYENRFNQFFNSFFFFNNSKAIASTFLFCNILTSEDGGLHWAYQEQLPPFQLYAITFVNDSTGWAVGTNGAILKFQGSYFKSDESGPMLPALAGNYPNPFNSKTTIYFNLSRPQEVSISIYNVIGKSIETLTVSSTIQGKNEINWQPQNSAAGLYFIKIQCQEFTKVVKCLFVK